MRHDENEVWSPILPIIVVVVGAFVLWILAVVRMFLSAFFDTPTMDRFILAMAKTASTLEIAIAIIGFALLVAAFLAYPGSQVDDDLRMQISNLSARFEKWRDRYSEFDAYLGYAKDWADSMLTIGQGRIDKNEWNNLIHTAIIYNQRLSEAFQRLGPVEQSISVSIQSISIRVEDHYLSKVRLSIILAAIGLGLIVLAIILPSSETLLGVLATGLVDPSLEGQEKLNAILEMKQLLRSL